MSRKKLNFRTLLLACCILFAGCAGRPGEDHGGISPGDPDGEGIRAGYTF